MAIKRGSKVDMNSSSASMTDLMFLLLIFLMIATTLINNNALQLTLPKSTSPTQDKPSVKLSITPDERLFIDETPISFDQLESALAAKFEGNPEPMIFLYTDQSVPVGTVVRVMNVAKDNNYKLNMATTPQ